MITIQQTPAKFTPAFNPVVFRISSDNYAQPNFKFVADVYDGSGNLLASFKYQPQVLGSAPIDIDVSKVLRELVSANYCRLNDTVGANVVLTGEGLISGYSVQFGEQYGGVVYSNLTNYGGYIFNGALNNKWFAFYSQAAYLNTKFLTSYTRQVARKRDSLMLSVLQSDGAAIPSFTFQIFNTAGASIYTNVLDNPFDSLVLTNNRALHIHCGFDHLFDQLGFDQATYDAAAYYTVTPTGGQPVRVDLYSKCERFPGIRLYFLNMFGGFDAFNFMLVSRQTVAAEKKNYLRQAANKRTGYDATSRRFEALSRNYHTKYTEKIKATSDYLTDVEAQALIELYRSPLIYMEADAGEYGGTAGQKILMPVDLRVNEYQVKSTRLDKMFNVEVDLDLTTENYLQSI